jgi:hypothetical protein
VKRTFLRFLFKVSVAVVLGSLVLFLASLVMPHLWSRYLGLSVGIAFSVIKGDRLFDRLWPEPKKGWAE